VTVPAEMPRLLEPLREGTADIVIGSRLAGERMAGWGLAAFDHIAIHSETAMLTTSNQASVCFVASVVDFYGAIRDLRL
jgi:hypothetical protein